MPDQNNNLSGASVPPAIQTPFPVASLIPNITRKLTSVKSADAQGCVFRGLNHQITLFDECSKISDVSKIVPNQLTGRHDVHLSLAYCQYLWLLADAVLRRLDTCIIHKSCAECNLTLDDYRKETDQLLGMTDEEFASKITCVDSPPAKSLKEYLVSIQELQDTDATRERFIQEMMLADTLLPALNTDFRPEAFKEIDIHTPYSQHSSSVVCYGIVFILMHELSHFSLGHTSENNTSEEDETAADLSAFWNIYSDVSQEERFSANLGIMAALFSLMMLNPTLESDKDSDSPHPREDVRLFAIYDTIKTENPKYAIVLLFLLELWSKANRISEFPTITSYDDDMVNTIKDFFHSHTQIEVQTH